MTKHHILIVEDEDDVRFMLRHNLEDHGYTCHLASEGIGAIQRLVEHPQITAILSDLRMPLFGGEYWLKFLSRFCVGRYKIILQTAYLTSNIPDGMTLIMKPYGLD